MANRERDGERERYWRLVLARFAASGRSVRAFCQQEWLHESAFYFWRRTLQQRDAQSPAKASVPTFLPVAISRGQREPSATQTSIELPGGLTIRIGDATPLERIAALVRALRAEAQA